MIAKIPLAQRGVDDEPNDESFQSSGVLYLALFSTRRIMIQWILIHSPGGSTIVLVFFFIKRHAWGGGFWYYCGVQMGSIPNAILVEE